MALYKYLRESFNDPSKEIQKIWKERIIQWRKEPVTIRISHPTRLDRARSLGYKAKPGLILVRQRVNRGGRLGPQIRHGRRPKRFRMRQDIAKSYQWVAEERTARKYPNCEILNSYFAAKDGLHYWYEIILVDKSHPAVLADPNMKWIAEKQHRGRVFRGLTASGKRSRGILIHKGKGAEKLRPSLRANARRGT
ncbi:MAG TPA: 50S ribosomal protein L15e [Candidatus Nanoarchaeia archaeon]|nr:50S ribosomal protein L15e [Candidatus Nanoarchaeia archaeon]